MKKLLLSLGALSAVVAPVAAVVACGSTNSDSTLDQAKAAALKNTTLTQEQKDAINGAKTMDALTTVLTEQTNAAGNAVDASEITDTATTLSPTEVATATVTKMLSDTGYSMTDEAKTKLITYLLQVSGDDTLTLGDELPGKLHDANHDGDDFAVLINGKVKDVSHVDGYFKTSTLHFKDADVDKSLGEQIGDINSSRQGQNDKWAYQNAEVSKARFVIWLQNDGTTYTLQVGEVFQFNGETFELDQPGDDPVNFKVFAAAKATA